MLSLRNLILTIVSLQGIKARLFEDQNVLDQINGDNSGWDAPASAYGTHPTTPNTLQYLMFIHTNRSFGIYLPQNYEAETAMPVIFSYHGHGKSMQQQATLSRFTEPSINPSHIAVFPQGLYGANSIDGTPERAWQGAPYAAEGVDDIGFTSDLLNWLNHTYNIDSSRIYASGKSNGGGFCDTLACNHAVGGRFAAFAMNSAALYTESDGSKCNAKGPIAPIMEFHGAADDIMHYDGGCSRHNHKSYPYPAIETWLHTWAVRAGCPNETIPLVSLSEDEMVQYTLYNCSGAMGSVQGYKVEGQKHWWISEEPNSENGGDTAPIEASSIMMEFFRNNSLKAA